MDLDMAQSAQGKHIESGLGFIAALDQSGGSTPKALGLYGIGEDSYSTELEMFDIIHKMRSRIVQAPAFNGDRIIGSILFANTMEREICGKPSATYLWEKCGIVPFLKIDQGLQDLRDGANLMKPIDGLDATLRRAKACGIFGTKMRSVIHRADRIGIDAIVAQQFETAAIVCGHGLMPIIEPEVTISISDKAEAERLLLGALSHHIDALPTGQQIMLKLTLPSEANFYRSLVGHGNVARVVALSGGYTRSEANGMLSKNTGMIASFSRALTQDLRADQSDEAFNRTIAASIDSIYAASSSGG